jgi:hypothetical protein
VGDVEDVGGRGEGGRVELRNNEGRVARSRVSGPDQAPSVESSSVARNVHLNTCVRYNARSPRRI